VTFVLMIPLMAGGFIILYPNGAIYFADWVMLFLSIAELVFVVPPIWYVRKHGFKLSSLGLKLNEPVKEIILGLIFGGVMLIANLAITWLVVTNTSIPLDDGGGDSLFSSGSIFEMIAWVIVMFAVVGFSEELLFRGFLQRRMEIYFRDRSKSYKMLALIITSIIFAAAHLDIVGLPTRFILGLFLGYLAQRRKYSLLGPSVAHGFNNAAVIVLVFFGF
ncbi:MAG: lysostaphin resistance A-like protein, partial [Candidatus Thorarchaeota archaeon]